MDVGMFKCMHARNNGYESRRPTGLEVPNTTAESYQQAEKYITLRLVPLHVKTAANVSKGDDKMKFEISLDPTVCDVTYGPMVTCPVKRMSESSIEPISRQDVDLVGHIIHSP